MSSDRQPPIIRKKDLSFLDMIYIPQIIAGLRITIAQMFRPKFTRQYPEERWNPPPSFRGRPVLVQQNETERCVACIKAGCAGCWRTFIHLHPTAAIGR